MRHIPGTRTLLLAAALSSASFSPARAMGEATTGRTWRPTGTPVNDVVFDPVRHRLLALGSTGDAGEILELSLTPDPTWATIASTGVNPPFALGRSLAYDPIQDRVVVQGGHAEEVTCACGLYCHTWKTGAGAWSLSIAGTPAWSPLENRPLQDTPLVADPARGRFLLYGGSYADCSVRDGSFDCDSLGGSRDLWQFDWQTSAWSKIAENGPDFSWYPLLCALDPIRDRLLVMRTGGAPHTVWALSLADDSGWSQVATTGSDPSLWFYRAEYDPATEALLLFSDDSLTALTLGGTPAWQPISTAGSGATVRGWDPVARKAWGCVSGGTVWELDAAGGWVWTPIAPTPPKPAMPDARRDHAVAYDAIGERTFIMGGASDYQETSFCSVMTGYGADLWSLGEPDDGARLELPPSSTYPFVHGDFDMGLLHDSSRNRLILVPRYAGIGREAWTLDLASPTGWVPIDPDGVRPTPQSIEVAAYDSAADRALLFGGPPGDALYAINLGTDPPAWQHLPIAGEPATAIDFERSAWDPSRRRLWALNSTTMQLSAIDVAASATWQAVPVAGTPPPPGMCLVTYDGTRDRLLVVRNGPAPFLWEIPLGAPAWAVVPVVAPLGAPLVKDGASFSFDPARDRALLFGGGNSLEQTGSGLYILQFGVDSTTSVAASLVAQDATPARVRLEWQVADAGGATFEVSRSEDGTSWSPLGSPRANGQDRLVVEDAGIRAGARYGYRLAVLEQGVTRTLDEVWVQVPAGFTTRLHGARPNPSADAFQISFELAEQGPATLELLDVQGRQLARLDVGVMGAGEHSVSLLDGRRLAPGLYFARLTRGRDVHVARVSVLR